MNRAPPCDLDAEAAVLSAILLDTRYLDNVRDLVSTEDFYAAANKWVFSAVLELVDAGRVADLVTVAQLLREREKLDGMGGTPYLHQLVNATPAVAHIEEHARIVVEKSRVRAVIRACQDTIAEAYGPIVSMDGFCRAADKRFFDAIAGRHESTAVWLADAVTGWVSEASAPKGVRSLASGFSEVDRLVGGWEPKRLYVVAGRPGTGKTAFGVATGLKCAKRGELVGIMSAEMSRSELAGRMVCSEAGVNSRSLDWELVSEAAERIKALPLKIDDRPAPSVGEVRSFVRKAQQERGQHMRLVVVDYLQLMSGTGDNREQEIASISRGLKALAKELDIAVIAVAQLNRGVESRQDKRPLLSDLRESGAIEADADCVIMLYRDEYYNKSTAAPNTCELIVRKQRSGATGSVALYFDATKTRFEDLSGDDVVEDR